MPQYTSAHADRDAYILTRRRPVLPRVTLPIIVAQVLRRRSHWPTHRAKAKSLPATISE